MSDRMKRPLRTYHEVGGEDRSRLVEQVVEQRARVSERLRAVRHVVAVMSGKGGVGKSYVTAGLAAALADRLEDGVGVLDADLNGPTAARLLEARGPVRIGEDAVDPATGLHDVKVFSMDLLLRDGEPLQWRQPTGERFIWRGTLETGAVREFLSDVAWGRLHVLLVDLPPGTGQVTDLVELVPELTGLLAVTIPSEESRRSVERAVRSAVDAGTTVLGVIENMSGYACDRCGVTQPLFGGDAGALLAAEFEVPLLGRIPFLPAPAPGDGGRERAMIDDAGAAPTPTRAPTAPAIPASVVDAFLEALQ